MPILPGDHDAGDGRKFRVCPHSTSKYTRAQVRIVAREVARGGKPADVIFRLRRDYESDFSTLSLSSLRKWMREPEFQKQVRHFQKLFDSAAAGAEAEAEKEKARAAALGPDELRAICHEAIRRLNKIGQAGDVKAFQAMFPYMEMAERLSAQGQKREFSPEDAAE